jgi:uncharacterized protein YdhG (YjbR/CyaY superfamily)
MKSSKSQPITIDSYSKNFPKDVQAVLYKVRSVIKKAAPKAEETMSYGMPTFKLQGKILVHFAAWKNHIGFYPTPTGIEVFKKDLVKYVGAKGSAQFPLTQKIPYDLIKKITLFRVKEVLNK